MENQNVDPVTGVVSNPHPLPEFTPPKIKITEVNVNAVNALPVTEGMELPKDEYLAEMPHTKEVKLEPDEIEEEIAKAKEAKAKKKAL